MATRALLDLRLLTRPDGAVLAGWHRGWAYAWPRDSSWVAAALAATGHSAQALGILEFLRRTAVRRRNLGGPVLAGRLGPGSRRAARRAGRGGLGAVGGLVLVHRPGPWAP